jgi:hypothetical protein
MTYLVLPELIRRTILQGTVRVHEIVIGEPGTQLRQYGCGIRRRIDRDVVALEGFDERLSHAIALRRGVRGSARDQADVGGKGARVASDVSRAVVAEPLRRMRQLLKEVVAVIRTRV